MKTQNLNLLNGLEAIELTNGQMEVITGGTSIVVSKAPPSGGKSFGLTAMQGLKKVTSKPPKKK